jgi:hypothetical protein
VIQAKQELTFGVGEYWTADERRAVVDAVTDGGQLVGRVDIGTGKTEQPLWMACMWEADGKSWLDVPGKRLQMERPAPKVRRTWWLNIYQDGPGLLRESWEHALIEASRETNPPLCRVEVKVDARVGEGLR